MTASSWMSSGTYNCGILKYSSLVVTTDGLPLGLAAIKFWTRKKFKGTNALKKKINLTRMPIEEKESFRWLENLKYSTDLLNDPSRCVHSGDRESDIYELFCLVQEKKTHFLLRTCVDRFVEDGFHTITKEMAKMNGQGIHSIRVHNKEDEEEVATLTITYHHMKILPPIGKSKKYPAIEATVIHARELMSPADRDAIDWKLITNLSIQSLEEAIEKTPMVCFALENRNFS